MENIRKLRGKAGLTQKQLADKIGVSRAAVHEMEKNTRHNVKKNVADKLCSLFNVNTFELYGLDNLKFLPANGDEASKLIDAIKDAYKL